MALAWVFDVTSEGVVRTDGAEEETNGSGAAAVYVRTDAVPIETRSIAVLPFANLSSDPEQEYLADGMTADIITGLSCDKRLVVIARNSTMQFKGKAPDVREVGAMLGARYAVEGSVRKMGRRLRITTELIDAVTGRALWAEKVDRDVEQIFEAQDEITEAIITAVTSNLHQAEEERFRRKPPEELEAWALCTRAIASYFSARVIEPETVEDALACVRRALEIDPGFAYVWGLLGFFTALKFPLGVSTDREADVEESLQATEQALRLDPRDPSVLTFRAVALQYAGRPAESIEYLERSLQLNPSDALTHLYYGRGLMFTGKPDRAVAHFERFRRLNPQDPGAHLAGMYHSLALLFLQRHAEAEQVARGSLAASGGRNPWSWVVLIAALAGQGRTREATKEVAQLHNVVPGWTRQFVESFLTTTQQDQTLVEPVLEILRAAWPD